MVVVVVSVLFWTVNLPRNQIVSSLSVSVPDVSGDTYDEAVATLEGKNLVPKQFSTTSTEVAAGNVVRTVPEAGADVSRQQVVKVYISLGRATVNVPTVAGLTSEEAQQTLTAQKLVIGTITQADSPDVPANTVMATVPAANTAAREGDVINLSVSTGLVTVPNLVGVSASAAGQQLTALELDFTVTTTTRCSGRVVSEQSLPPGSYPQASAIIIKICTGS
jgi:serine/threonine-protein kinase